MGVIISFAVDAAITGFILWLASKLTSVDLQFKETVIAVLAASVVAFVPIVGWLASIVILFYFLQKFSGAKVWPDLILMVIVSKFLSFLVFLMLRGLY